MPDATSSCLTLLAAWALIGFAGLVRPSDLRFVGRVLFPLGAVVGVALALVALASAAAPWDCGFGRLDARMQDTAEGFGQPIRHIFQPFFAMLRELPSPFDAAPHYRVTVDDRIWTHAYLPIALLVRRAARAVAWLQQGRIATYLLYSFVTLLVMLGLVL